MADDMREKGLAIQTVLVNLECNSWIRTILGEWQYHLITLKVLGKKKNKNLLLNKSHAS